MLDYKLGSGVSKECPRSVKKVSRTLRGDSLDTPEPGPRRAQETPVGGRVLRNSHCCNPVIRYEIDSPKFCVLFESLRSVSVSVARVVLGRVGEASFGFPQANLEGGEDYKANFLYISNLLLIWYMCFGAKTEGGS